MQPQKLTVNRIQLIGNLAADPEVKYFPSGSCKLSGRMGVTRKVKDEKVTDWFNIEAWGDVAEGMAEVLKKGARVGVSGPMINNTWTDRDGKKRDGWTVKVYDWEIQARRDDAPAEQAPDLDEVPF